MTYAALPSVSHWIDGQAHRSTSGRTGDVFDPATGTVTKQVAFASADDVDAAVAAGRDAFASWRASSLAKRSRILFRFRELLDQRTDELAEIITSEHGKVASDAQGEVARGLEVVEFACGIPHLLKGGFSEGVSDRVDVVVDPPAPRRRRDHQPVQLPRDGAVLVLPDRDRGGQHGDPQAEREGSVGRELVGRALDGGGSPGRRVQRRARRQGRGRPPSRTSRRQVGLVRRLHADRALRLRDRDALPASACRRSAAPRTTWSCSPTPTSISPPTPR